MHQQTLELRVVVAETWGRLVRETDDASVRAEVEKARYQSALDQGEQAKAALRQSRDDLAKTTIYAPMSGTVSRLNKEIGEIALGSQFQEDVILEISNLEGMEALVDIDENDIDDYVNMNWLEWKGGSLQLTVTGDNVCKQLRCR